jgi:cyclophilin family peptidyl-prolyl cis-trans isomerase
VQNKPDTNGAQFFFTLDRADHCNRQYTVFGKITGKRGRGGAVLEALGEGGWVLSDECSIAGLAAG